MIATLRVKENGALFDTGNSGCVSVTLATVATVTANDRHIRQRGQNTRPQSAVDRRSAEGRTAWEWAGTRLCEGEEAGPEER